jgi:hypothetical protein
MTVFNARALASLVTVAGNALSRRLTVILNALIRVFEDDIGEELREAVDEAVNALLFSEQFRWLIYAACRLDSPFSIASSPSSRVRNAKVSSLFADRLSSRPGS